MITRSQARLLRSVLRHSIVALDSRRQWPLLHCASGSSGTVVQAVGDEVAIRRHHPESRAKSVIAFRSSVLANIEGRSNAPVTITSLKPGSGQAEWNDHGIPSQVGFDTVTPDSIRCFPELPKKLTSMPDHFPEALAEAIRTITTRTGRRALERILLCGKTGEIIATDSRQLLIQGGFHFPWSDDVLIPSVPAFAKKSVLPSGAISVGRTESHVLVALGEWTFALRIDVDSRYPDVHAVIPAGESAARLHVDAEDVAALLKMIPTLPGGEEHLAPVTLDLGKRVVVRAKAHNDDSTTEVELCRSRWKGKSMRACLNRRHLLRALQLGFHEITLFDPERPVLCTDDHRTYLFTTLGTDACSPPAPDSTRILSTSSCHTGSISSRPTLGRKPTVPQPLRNGQNRSASSGKSESEGPIPQIDDLIHEAEELRRLHQDIGSRLSKWISAMKQQRKQSRAVRQAVASLQQIRLDG